MDANDRDVLLEAPPLEREARVRELIDRGYAPARVLAEAPFLAPQIVLRAAATSSPVEVLPVVVRRRARGASGAN